MDFRRFALDFASPRKYFFGLLSNIAKNPGFSVLTGIIGFATASPSC